MQRPRLAIALALAFTLASPVLRAAEPPLETDDQKTLYALGLAMAQKLAPFDLKGAELDIVMVGVRDGIANAKPKVDLSVYGPKIQTLAEGRINAMIQEETAAGKIVQDKCAAEKGAVRSETGLIMVPMKAGTGKSPTTADKVRVHYHGTLRDGTVFDSSVQRGQPVEFPLGQVVRCWQEALPKMKVGEKSKVVCPASLAYGNDGNPPAIKPGATLTFEIELLDVLPPDPAPPAPGGAPAPEPGH